MKRAREEARRGMTRRASQGKARAASQPRGPQGLLERLWDWAVKELIENILIDEATLITGPPGCGKTTLAIVVAHVLGRPIQIFNYGGAFDPEASVAGGLTLQNGRTVFSRSRLVEALIVPNCIIVLDEIARAPAEVVNALLSLLDFQGRLVLDLETRRNRIVERAPGTSFIATANLDVGCVGSGPLDRAFLDRMLHLRLDYPDPQQEARLLLEFGVTDQQAAQLVARAGAVRAQYARGVFDGTISTRGLTRAAKLTARGNEIDRSIERSMYLADDESRAKLRTTLRAVK